MRNILVTGGAGFIGSNFVRYMLEKYPDYRIVVYDKLTYAGRLENLQDVAERFRGRYTFVQGDICDASKVNAVMKEHRIDAVVNFAAESVLPNTFIPVHLGHSIRLETIEELFNRYAKESGIERDENGTEIVSVKGKLSALSFRNGMGTWSQVTHITRHRYRGDVILLKQKWGQITVTPNHSVYDAHARLVSAESNPELLAIRKINLDRSRFKDRFTLRLRGCRIDEAEGRIYYGQKPYPAPKQVWVRREYAGESLKALLRFLAAYIAEGNATYNQANGSWQVSLSNMDLSLLEGWQQDVRLFSNATGVITRREYPAAHQLVFNSRLLYELVTQLCGRHAGQKVIPHFIYNLQDEYKEEFLATYLAGDGSTESYKTVRSRRFCTTSPRLAAGMGLLLSLLDLDYSVYTREPSQEQWADSYNFRLVSRYDSHLNLRMHRFAYDGYVYDLTVEGTHNFAAGIGNIVVHNTHVDRSLMGPGSFIQTDIYGTYVLLEAAKEHGVERYHQVSSVTGDTPILVRDEETGEVALRPIASLDGEEITRYSVLTMTDEYQVAFRPLHRFIKHPADEVYEITYTGGGRLRATGTHSVFVFDGSRIVTKPVRELQAGDFLVTFVGDVWPEAQPHVFELRQLLRGYSYRGLDDTLRRHQQVLATVQARPARYTEPRRALHGQIAGTTVYRIAQTLAEGGYLEKTPGGVYALTQDALSDAWERLDDLWWDAVKRKLPIKRDRIVVTPLLMEVFGLYLAKGHCSPTEAEMAQDVGAVVFTLGREEQAALDKLVRCAREVLGIEPSIGEQESSVQVQYSSYWVHALFRQFGATAETKRLPPWIWTQPKSLIEAFFRGYEGDGTVKADGRRHVTTVNRSLAAELVWLARLHDLNMQITGEHYRRSESGSRRTPMARCVPTAAVVENLGCHQHRGVEISHKPLVGKDEALALAATLENPPERLMQLLNSPVGVAKVRAVRRVPGTVMVYDVSVPGNERFFGGNVPCLLHNTDEVYGEILEGRATETYPLHTRSPYSASKAGGDLMCLAYYHSFDLPVTITRGSNNIGPYQYPEKVVPLFITNAIDDLPLPLYGDGSQMRDYQYVLDHCEGIDVVLHKGKPGEIYNLGTGVETRNIDMARMILDLLGKPHSLIQPVRDRPGHDRRYALDIRKVQALGWRSRHTFEEALEKTVRWYVENEWWWRPIKSGEFYQEYYRRQYAGRELT